MIVTLQLVLHTGETKTLDVQPGGSVMEAAVANGVEGIEAQCYGAGVCGTCRVRVDPQSLAAVGGPGDWESEMLEQLPSPQSNARLSCQIDITTGIDGAIFHIPEHQQALG